METVAKSELNNDDTQGDELESNHTWPVVVTGPDDDEIEDEGTEPNESESNRAWPIVTGPDDDDYAFQDGVTAQEGSTVFDSEKKHEQTIAKRSVDEINCQPPLLAEAARMLTLSAFVYIFADLRLLSKLGKTKLPMDYLSVESDEMTYSEIIKGVPHMFRAYDTFAGVAGKSGNDVMLALMRVLAETGLPDARKSNKKKFKDAVTKLKVVQSLDPDFKRIRDDENESGQTLQDLFYIDNLFKRSLKHAPSKCHNHCRDHVGNVCSGMGLHYMQLFLDQIYRLAETNPACADFVDKLKAPPSMQSREISRKSGSIEPEVDSQILVIFKELMRPDSVLMQMQNSAQEHKSRVVWMNDRLSEFECVYFILFSRASRRITVVFRGSATLTDWLHNVRYQPHRPPNPIKEDYDGKLDYIEINQGYYQYLMARRQDTGRSKFDEIADKAFEYGEELGEGGFTLCSAGHSMGGALSSLFAFYASVDPRFSKNAVRNFTFGGAFAGRVTYAQAFQHQEKVGRILHARFECSKDIVPCARVPAFQNAHTGVGIMLHGYSLSRAPSYNYVKNLTWWSTFWATISTNFFLRLPWLTLWKLIEFHMTESYAMSLHAQTAALTKQDRDLAEMSLEEVYKKFVHDGDVDASDEGESEEAEGQEDTKEKPSRPTRISILDVEY